MFLKSGTIKIADATYLIIAKNDNDVELTISDKFKNEHIFKGLNMKQVNITINKVLSLPLETIHI